MAMTTLIGNRSKGRVKAIASKVVYLCSKIISSGGQGRGEMQVMLDGQFKENRVECLQGSPSASRSMKVRKISIHREKILLRREN
jgi:hypothetical protein